MFIAMIVILNIVYTMMIADWCLVIGLPIYLPHIDVNSVTNSARDMMVNSVVESTAMLFPEK